MTCSRKPWRVAPSGFSASPWTCPVYWMYASRQLSQSGGGFLQVPVHGIKEAFGREPGLLRPHQDCQILRHAAFFNGGNSYRLQRAGKFRQRRIAVKLGAVLEATGPGED